MLKGRGCEGQECSKGDLSAAAQGTSLELPGAFCAYRIPLTRLEIVPEQIQSNRDQDLLYSKRTVELGSPLLSTETAAHLARTQVR